MLAKHGNNCKPIATDYFRAVITNTKPFIPEPLLIAPRKI